MSDSTVNVTILDKEYQISCGPEERDALTSSARYLNDKMAEIKQNGNVIGLDRIAVMAALNIAHEFLQGDNEKGANEVQLQRLADKISTALGNQSKLQL